MAQAHLSTSQHVPEPWAHSGLVHELVDLYGARSMTTGSLVLRSDQLRRKALVKLHSSNRK